MSLTPREKEIEKLVQDRYMFPLIGMEAARNIILTLLDELRRRPSKFGGTPGAPEQEK